MRRALLIALTVAAASRAEPRWSIDAVGGGWALARTDGGRALEPAFGARLGAAWLAGRLETDLRVARAVEEAGSAFVSARTTHDLLSARAAAVGTRGALSLFAGLGVGLARSSSRWSIQDAVGPRLVRTAVATQPAPEGFAGARVRLPASLEARLELAFVLRDGRLEGLPALGIGAAF